jgi:hypothetical protein
MPGPSAPNSLRRILIELINPLQIANTQEQFFSLVFEAEKQLLAANIAYYQNLQNYLKTLDVDGARLVVLKTVQDMVQIQMNRILAYQTMVNNAR